MTSWTTRPAKDGGQYGGPWSDPCLTDGGSDFTRLAGEKRGRMADDYYDILDYFLYVFAWAAAAAPTRAGTRARALPP